MSWMINVQTNEGKKKPVNTTTDLQWMLTQLDGHFLLFCI